MKSSGFISGPGSARQARWPVSGCRVYNRAAMASDPAHNSFTQEPKPRPTWQ